MDSSSKDRSANPPAQESFKRLVMVSGKVYYDLFEERKKRNLEDQVALVRIEQLNPFPYDLVMREIRRFPNAELMWCQEEPLNMGPYAFVEPRLGTCLRAEGKQTPGPVKYAGRRPSAATATGFGSLHAKELAQFLDVAMTLP